MFQLETQPCPICGEAAGGVHVFKIGTSDEARFEAHYACIGCDEDTKTEGPTVTAGTEEEAESAAIRAWNKWVIDHRDRKQAETTDAKSPG